MDAKPIKTEFSSRDLHHTIFPLVNEQPTPVSVGLPNSRLVVQADESAI